MEWCFRQFAQIRARGVGATGFARQYDAIMPGMPSVTEPLGLEHNTVGFS
jgi:hypothetical protein